MTFHGAPICAFARRHSVTVTRPFHDRPSQTIHTSAIVSPCQIRRTASRATPDYQAKREHENQEHHSHCFERKDDGGGRRRLLSVRPVNQSRLHVHHTASCLRRSRT
jgi:hypothetical protein